MEVARQVLLFLHLLGLASLVGGWLVQVAATEGRTVTNAILHGAITQVVTGLGLVGVLEGLDRDVDNVKVAVKLAVGLVVLALAWVNRRRGVLPSGLFFGLGGLAVANVAVAVFWT